MYRCLCHHQRRSSQETNNASVDTRNSYTHKHYHVLYCQEKAIRKFRVDKIKDRDVPYFACQLEVLSLVLV